MKKDKIVEQLVATFGASVRVHTEHHMQVSAGENQWHDIWVKKDNLIIYRLCGKRSSKESYSIKDVIGVILHYKQKNTDIAAMRNALRLGESIQMAHDVLSDHKLKNAIFVDGGWKEGKAKIAAILVRKNGDSDVKVRHIECKSSSEAEMFAMLLGYELRQTRDSQGIQHDDTEIPIYTDCQPIFTHPDLAHIKNKHWIPRSRNKSADHLGNMRGRR